MLFLVILSANTITGIMLCDKSKMFTHAFTKSPLGVTDVLLEAYSAGYAVYDIVSFAVAMYDGVISLSRDRTCNGAGMV